MRRVFSWIAWPGLLALCIAGYAYGNALGHPILTYNITYFGMAAALLLLERLMPYEAAWAKSDGQMRQDISHTALNKGIGQFLASLAAVIGANEVAPAAAGGLWPAHWPMAAQVVLGLVVAEFGLYWAHRLCHEVSWLWPYHAVHHSVTRLWVVNTGRFHFVDSLLSSGFALALGMLVGAPKEVIVWVLVITTYIGFLTHCNVDMDCRGLNWLFNTPDLHRWHHSRIPAEGNTNYGENLLLWDVIFRTRYLPSDRRPPVDIGTADAVPLTFLGQLAFPFRRPRAAPILEAPVVMEARAEAGGD
ncbi:sterol desaturase family protein [Nitrospirillum viridazoti]|uniref:Sterol desaturase n=1 Tax=Nitrospirillum viridazoti CBAmc TaxID=1441467 RepID=A0A248JQ71_9PROT|nr:sterol desaturase family protein [Nitrospirillum amazonense]ASG20631.1 sterol desaturase [Nitrospirillum amazonense CBAmc]TWB34259.1 sterol desaturase/sphingolipid hydroxylase (fatty acid hydroxylase superfamily) [Nitrospirillum amazonense]